VGSGNLSPPGVLLLKQPGTPQAEAETWLQRALDVARRQEAKSLELRAAMSLSCLWQQQAKRADAHALLAPIYGWFTEGFDTADLQDAKELLEALAYRYASGHALLRPKVRTSSASLLTPVGVRAPTINTFCPLMSNSGMLIVHSLTVSNSRGPGARSPARPSERPCLGTFSVGKTVWQLADAMLVDDEPDAGAGMSNRVPLRFLDHRACGNAPQRRQVVKPDLGETIDDGLRAGLHEGERETRYFLMAGNCFT
jgi:hypothetical protein